MVRGQRLPPHKANGRKTWISYISSRISLRNNIPRYVIIFHKNVHIVSNTEIIFLYKLAFFHIIIFLYNFSPRLNILILFEKYCPDYFHSKWKRFAMIDKISFKLQIPQHMNIQIIITWFKTNKFFKILKATTLITSSKYFACSKNNVCHLRDVIDRLAIQV